MARQIPLISDLPGGIGTEVGGQAESKPTGSAHLAVAYCWEGKF